MCIRDRYIVHEVFDGRFDAYTEVTSSVSEIVTDAVTSAIQSAGLTVKYLYPLQGTLNSETVYLPCSNQLSSGLKVHVTEAPLSEQEWLFTGENGVVLSVTIDPVGSYVVETYPVESGGLLTVTPVNYQSGTALFTYEGILTEYLDFTTETPDFVEIYEDTPCP